MITALGRRPVGRRRKRQSYRHHGRKGGCRRARHGGNNAGHTVVSGGKTYKLHLVPSGILYDGTLCCIGPGCVVDPLALLKEMDEVKANGTSLDGLRIDYRAHIVMPYHLLIDELSEEAKGEGGIGTTKKGIGPCYMDKAERIGIRFYDILHPEVFAEKLRANLNAKNKYIGGMFGYGKTALRRKECLDFAKIFAEYTEAGKKLAAYAADTTVIVYDAHKAGKNVLFEGAQGTLLDIDHGHLPLRHQLPPRHGRVLRERGRRTDAGGRVHRHRQELHHPRGQGTFPTELFDETGDYIREAGFEYGPPRAAPVAAAGWTSSSSVTPCA